MYACQISVSTQGLLGQGCSATADGRLEGTTFADASMSAYPGTDKGGPYALFNSATVWDHSESQNSQMNLKLHPTAVKNYRDLMIRVAGFTQYWVEIGKPIQDEVVARTEYEGV